MGDKGRTDGKSQTIALVAMVKNEADNIKPCLMSALPYIDAWTILDTGSTDGTQDLIMEILDGIPGTLHQGEFVNFAVSRTQLFDHARGVADYLMLLDADMQVVYPDTSLPQLTSDCYEGMIVGPATLEYALPILVKGDRRWYYEGVAHAYLACEGPWSSDVLPDLKILDGSHTTIEKLQLDLKLLSEEHARNPLHARTVFYLAQTYFDLDMFDEAIQFYRLRADMDGWDEETFYARYRLGALLCEHVSFAAGAKELMAAWEMRPHRVEPLRVLANVADNVADKFPLPTDRLFVKTGAYRQPEPEAPLMPPQPSIHPGRVRRQKKGPLTINEVAAIIVTRGNVDLGPILATLPFEQVVIWDNSKSDHDYKIFGRYAAIPETTKPVIYWQDDDVIFTEFDKLLDAYDPGEIICNMDDPWLDACGYRGIVGLMGAGSLCDRALPARIFKRYFAQHPWDDDALVEADFIFGTLAPFKVVDLGYEPREFTDDADRLYQQPGQNERKWRIIERCLAMK